MEQNYIHYRDDPEQLENEWTVIGECLSTLPFNPLNQMDWALWMLVHNRQDDAPCITSAYAVLQKTQPKMNEVFQKHWPLVSTIYDDEEQQQEMAARYYKESLDNTENMPQFTIDL